MAEKKMDHAKLNLKRIYDRVRPFRNASGVYFVTNFVKDDQDVVQETEHFPMMSDEGHRLIVKAVGEELEGKPDKSDLVFACDGLQGFARERVTEEATFLVDTSDSSASSKSRNEVTQKAKTEKESAAMKEINEKVQFYVDDKYRVMGRFLDSQDGRSFPLSHPSMRATVFLTLGASATNAEFNRLMQHCAAEALKDFRTKFEIRRELLDTESILDAVQGMMVYRQRNKKNAEDASFEGNLTALRQAVEEIANGNGICHDGWPKGSHLASTLWDLKDRLRERNIKLEYKPTGICRKYTVSWIDKSNIEIFEVNDPIPNATKAKSDANDAKTQPVASQPSPDPVVSEIVNEADRAPEDPKPVVTAGTTAVSREDARIQDIVGAAERSTEAPVTEKQGPQEKVEVPKAAAEAAPKGTQVEVLGETLPLDASEEKKPTEQIASVKERASQEEECEDETESDPEAAQTVVSGDSKGADADPK